MQSLQPCLTEGCDADHRSELWSPWPLSEWSTCRKWTLTQGNLNQQRNKNKQGLLFIVCLVFSFSNFWCSATLRHGRECLFWNQLKGAKPQTNPNCCHCWRCHTNSKTRFEALFTNNLSWKSISQSRKKWNNYGSSSDVKLLLSQWSVQYHTWTMYSIIALSFITQIPASARFPHIANVFFSIFQQ